MSKFLNRILTVVLTLIGIFLLWYCIYTYNSLSEVFYGS